MSEIKFHNHTERQAKLSSFLRADEKTVGSEPNGSKHYQMYFIIVNICTLREHVNIRRTECGLFGGRGFFRTLGVDRTAMMNDTFGRFRTDTAAAVETFVWRL
jgi:hypothetical protein